MFRTTANPMDEVVVKATDENLTSENWEYILDVCDRVSASASGPAQAVQSLIKRLAHRNANVQLYTLELANALSQNCGAQLHRELASKAFTDALLRLTADRNTHAQVKQKVLERMGTWTEEFKGNPELGIMEQAYHKLRTQQPSLMPPSKPGKREISREDRAKEDEELQMALALSVQDKGAAAAGAGAPAKANGTNGTVRDDSEPQPAQSAAGAQAQGTTAATVSRVRALYDFTPSEAGELAFRKNDIIAVLESVYKDWWKGSLRGQTGIFPLNYVEKLQDPTKEELERDANMESEVFSEIRNVEKLLALLSVREGGSRRGEKEEEEISKLYQRTLSIRPKLIELIGKYSQKKDDFTQLNEKFIKARRDYEALLESSMSQSQYGQHPQQLPYRQPGARQSVYPPQHLQQQGYGQQPPPQQGYPPQGTPHMAGYPPQQQPYAAQSQQHLPPPQQDQSHFYSQAPSETSSQPPPQGYGSPYPPHQNGPPPAPASGSAPFHFIPGGVQGPPQPNQEVRRKPSPAALQAQAQQNGPSDPYGTGGAPISAGPGPMPGQGPPPGFQGQLRPNSIHTLNSGNPQELATGGYESPIDNRHSYPTAQQMPLPQQGYEHYPPQQLPQQQQQQAPPPTHDDRSGLPSRRRTQSFESPTSMYSTLPPSAEAGYPQGQQLQQQQQPQPQQPPYGMPPQPSHAPPSAPPVSPPVSGQVPYQAYQPYQPGAAAAGGGPGDPGDYYR